MDIGNHFYSLWQQNINFQGIFGQISVPASGVNKISVGVVDKFTPYSVCSQQLLISATCLVYGNGDALSSLFEDDGIAYDYDKGYYSTMNLFWSNGRAKVKRDGQFKGSKYNIKKWINIK